MLTAIIAAAVVAAFANPLPVTISGYNGEAMEPFVSPDGKVLLFNDRNGPGDRTDLHWAVRTTSWSFRYRGRIAGANSAALDGVPSLDREGNLYFVSTRSYDASLSTIYRARFAAGRATRIEIVPGVSRQVRGMVNFDAEISADAKTLYAVDGRFDGGPNPVAADLFAARRVGGTFERLPASIMANVNTRALEYAPCVSADGLELFFTRATPAGVSIERATRPDIGAAFGVSQRVAAISGFAEAPALADGGHALYYHARVGGRFRIIRVSRP